MIILTINVKREFIYKCYTHNYTSKTAKLRNINLVVEHIVAMSTYSATKFAVLITAVWLSL